MQVVPKIALITGAAKGIGKAIAMTLAKHQYAVVINYQHSKKEALALKEMLDKECPMPCLAIQADVSKEDEVDAMVSQVEKELGYIDILINNAAIDLSNLFHLKTAEEFRRTLDVNVVGAYNCAKRVYPHMIEKEYGKIINISSTNGMNSYYPMSFDYDASKAALISLTHNLAWQCSPYVNVNAIAPGFIGTESELDGYDEDFLQKECEKILVQRYGKPEEVANLVRFLISDEASYINNTVIRIDGGQMGSC
ncbi:MULTISPECIES: SDR family NAD(P)-dependent oxidoreductase [Terrabacteria group]|uniref:SDR family NAD(P)-dependent oxidoreductase n=1 Tax=Bacillati TaxID=1783272 RepID=UPI0019394C23|nr:MULTISPECIES: SDR family oxidoreductase [Terrabacteria group]MBW9212590.1 SDR family oxidoreductase [Trueperella sp. zg.1013]QRG87459.1 SDR family oxidoreductase [Bulleidia sp. zg-1006]